jgi:hypothetical protein
VYEVCHHRQRSGSGAHPDRVIDSRQAKPWTGKPDTHTI